MMLNFFLICVRKNPKYKPTEIVKAIDIYKKQFRFVTMNAMQLRRALNTIMKCKLPCTQKKSLFSRKFTKKHKAKAWFD